MTARIAGAVALAVATGVSFQASPPPAPRLEGEVVTYVRVIDVSRGRPVAGLGAADFDLSVDGVPTPVRSLTTESGPLRVAVVIDVSRSVDLRESGEAWLFGPALDRVLFSRLEADDRVWIGGVGSRLSLAGPARDRGQLLSAVDRALRLPDEELHGPSPLWDEIDAVCATLERETGHRAVLLVSDGRATGNRLSLGAIAIRAALANVTVSAIGEASSSIMRQDETTLVRVSPEAGLRTLTDTTGGTYQTGVLAMLRLGPDVMSFDPAPQLAQIIADLRSAYALAFTSVADGARHAIEVKMRPSGLRAVTRKFYLAPTRSGP